jgi:hypothetical protein
VKTRIGVQAHRQFSRRMDIAPNIQQSPDIISIYPPPPPHSYRFTRNYRRPSIPRIFPRALSVSRQSRFSPEITLSVSQTSIPYRRTIRAFPEKPYEITVSACPARDIKKIISLISTVRNLLFTNSSAGKAENSIRPTGSLPHRRVIRGITHDY